MEKGINRGTRSNIIESLSQKRERERGTRRSGTDVHIGPQKVATEKNKPSPKIESKDLFRAQNVFCQMIF